MSGVHPIEAESYRILAGRVDLTGMAPLTAAVVARMIHASADTDFAEVTTDERCLEAAVAAIRGGAPVVTDVEMVRAGLSRPSECWLGRAEATAGTTRSAAGMRLAAAAHRVGAVWVVGCAPTALAELVATGDLEPALVIGLPVGFVGAAEAKAALRDSGLPAISNVGEKGGSAVAAAAFNALARVAAAG